MHLIRKFNKGIRFLLCVIDIFSKHDWAVPLKDKEEVAIVNAFQNFKQFKKKTKQNIGR